MINTSQSKNITVQKKIALQLLTARGLRMSGYTDESLNSDTRLSRASPARCSMAWSWVSMGLAAALVTRRLAMVTRVMMEEVSMVMCTGILMLRLAPHTVYRLRHSLHMRTQSHHPSLHPGQGCADRTTWFFRRIMV